MSLRQRERLSERLSLGFPTFLLLALLPYAAPPVGEARWQAPQAVASWTEPRQATAFGADCAQAPSEAEPIQTTPAEDCLFVNVWQPENAAPDAGLPVMVWVHGGGFVGGGSSIP